MKDVGIRIRVEPKLRQDFVSACKELDLTASQVIRAFMRSFVSKNPSVVQEELFRMSELVSDEGLEKYR